MRLVAVAVVPCRTVPTVCVIYAGLLRYVTRLVPGALGAGFLISCVHTARQVLVVLVCCRCCTAFDVIYCKYNMLQ